MTRCGKVTGYEGFGEDDPLLPIKCLLPRDHEGPHADWAHWIGVNEPDFTRPGKSVHEA